MFYAKFKGIENSDVAEFQTEQQRDEWVNFQDEFSRDFDTTVDNCVFGREKLTNEDEIKSVVENKNIPTAQDEILPYIKWYLRSNIC
jgi:hypothetical protein